MKKIISALLAVVCVISLSAVRINAEESTYNYLALGDSVTIHPVCDYWWQECGMAASVPDKDYVHLVAAYLKQNYSTVNTKIYNGDWGISDQLLENYYKNLTKILQDKTYQLITIQYGINLRSAEGAEDAFSALVETCEKYAPNARIVLVGNIWGYADFMNKIDDIKQTVAKKYGCGFADLTEIKDNTAYERGIGGIVYDAAGNAHTVTNAGAARHPNDEGMAYIAQKIEEQINPQIEIDTDDEEETADDSQSAEKVSQTSTATKTATAHASKAGASAENTVVTVPFQVTSVLDLYVNKTAVLTCNNASGTVSWQADNNHVSLSSQTGTSIQVTGVTPGTSTVTVTMNGLSSQCYIFVSKQPLSNGWHKTGKKKYYYVDNTPLKGLQMIGKKFYLFNKKGVYQAKKTKELRKVLKKNTTASKVKKILKKNGISALQVTKKKKKQTWYYDGFKLVLQLKEAKKSKKKVKAKLTLVKIQKLTYKDGMHKVGKRQYYYVNNRKLKGIRVIKSKFYVFDQNGKYQKAKSNKLRKASVLNADVYKLKNLLKKYGATYKYTTDLGYSCFGDGTDQVVYYTDFQVSALKHTNGQFTVENIASY